MAFKEEERVSPARRERIFRAAEKLGYHPNFLARSLAAEHSSFIGILLSNMHNPLFPEIADAAREVFEAAGWHSLITSAAAPGGSGASGADKGGIDKNLVQMFHDLRPSGVLVVGTLLEGGVLPPATPIAFASSVRPEGASGPVVRVDDHAGIALAVDHLVAQGRRRIAFVGGEGGAVSSRRLSLFQEIVEERSVESLILAADLTEASGFEAFSRAIAQGCCMDAVVAVNDLAAIGVQSAADQAGYRVPEDVAIVGFDNTFLSALRRISMTSVDPQNAHVGSQAARALLDVMGQPAALQEQLIAPELVVRASSAGATGR